MNSPLDAPAPAGTGEASRPATIAPAATRMANRRPPLMIRDPTPSHQNAIGAFGFHPPLIGSMRNSWWEPRPTPDSRLPEEDQMCKKVLGSLTSVALAGVIFATLASAGGTPPSAAASWYEPVLDPSHFVAVIDNPYFPLPVGRTLVYTGIKDGKTQIDRVTVTSDTKVLEGVTATAVHDVA